MTQPSSLQTAGAGLHGVRTHDAPMELRASRQRLVTSHLGGTVVSIDNRRIARVAKLAGAPRSNAAGVAMCIQVGDRVFAGQLLYTVHAETIGELEYALDHVSSNPDIAQIGADELVANNLHNNPYKETDDETP